jgi:hypothetical protein
MSIVTNLMGKLHFIGAIQSKVVSFESRLPSLLIHAPHFRLSSSRDWSSTKDRRNFDTTQLSRRAYAEAQGRIPIAR